jgi:predicted DNA-binding protein
MNEHIDKARKYIAVWGETADRLKALSERVGRTQIELAHDAIAQLDAALTAEGGSPHAG